MVPDPSKTCLGMEYFCSEGDDLWEMPNEKLIELASEEIARLGLGVKRGDGEYRQYLKVLEDYIPWPLRSSPLNPLST